MKLGEIYKVLDPLENVKVYDCDPDDAEPGGFLFYGTVVDMPRRIGDLFDDKVIRLSGGYLDVDIVIQLEEV